MFQSIEYYEDNSDAYQYYLTDSDFGMVSCPVISGCGNSIVRRIVAIIGVYQTRGLSVAPNIARFYLWDRSYVSSYLEYHRDTMERWHPSLQYGIKYYPCVINQIKQLTYGKRKNR